MINSACKDQRGDENYSRAACRSRERERFSLENKRKGGRPAKRRVSSVYFRLCWWPATVISMRGARRIRPQPRRDNSSLRMERGFLISSSLSLSLSSSSCLVAFWKNIYVSENTRNDLWKYLYLKNLRDCKYHWILCEFYFV